MAPHWACARLQAQRERLALHTLGLAQFTVYLPRIVEPVVRRGRREEVHRPLFPGYCFILIIDCWWSIQYSPGVLSLLLDGGRPARVPEASSMSCAGASGLMVSYACLSRRSHVTCGMATRCESRRVRSRIRSRFTAACRVPSVSPSCLHCLVGA